jgi:hypothetical protein
MERILEKIKRIGFAEPDRQAVENAVIQAVETDPEKFIQAYVADEWSHGGRYICSDLFKEQFEQFSASNENRDRYTNPVHNASAVLASEQYRRTIANVSSTPERDTVIFLTGIPGAGKTSSVIRDGKPFPENCCAIYEGQLSRPAFGIKKIQQALDAGLKPYIVVVHSKSENALENTFKRFAEHGRGASINVMAEIQGDLPNGLQEIHRYFGDKVALIVKDHRDRNHPKTLEGWKHLNVLGSEGNHEEIKRRLEAELERQRPIIGEAVYRHARGLASMAPGVVGGNRRELQADVPGRGLSPGSCKTSVLSQDTSARKGNPPDTG